MTSAYFALFTGCDIGNDGWGNILFGGGLGWGEGKNEVDAENNADEVTAAVSLLDPTEPTDPKNIWSLRFSIR